MELIIRFLIVILTSSRSFVDCENAANVIIETENDIWLDEKPDYENLIKLSKNVTRCTTTELSLQKETFLHNWELDGILQYLEHSRKFNQQFQVTAEDIIFKSDHVDGKWSFKISRSVSTPTSNSDIKISATYSYEAKHQNQIHFAILFSVVLEDEEMVLPVQTSTNLPVIVQQQPISQRTKSKGVAQTPTLEFKYNFNWPNLSELENMTNVSKYSSVLFRFVITAYNPNPVLSSRTDACREKIVRDFVAKKLPMTPPFLKHTAGMLNDDRYFDLVIRAGNEEFLAHRVILAASSPIFSSLLYNESTLQSHNETVRIQMEDDVRAESVEEMLRYLYTGKVEKLGQTAENLILVAHRYVLPELKGYCEEWMLSKVGVDNAVRWYHLGLNVNSPTLAAKSFAIIRTNKSKLFPTAADFQAFNDKHPALVFDIFQSS